MKNFTQSSAESSRISRDTMLMAIAEIAALRSTCLRKRVGAVAAIDGRPVAIGYAGSAPGDPHCLDVGCLLGDDGGCIRTQHAEANLIAFASRLGIELGGADIYSTLSPCLACAKLLVASGVRVFHYLEEYRNLSGIIYLTDHGVAIGHAPQSCLQRLSAPFVQ